MARRTNDDFNNLNKDDREAGTGLIVSYQSEEGGITLAVPGDDDAPYVIANGRASDDGTAGLVEEPNGEMQRIAVSEYGHVWVKVSSLPTPTPTPITTVTDQLPAEGSIALGAVTGLLYRVTLTVYTGAGFMQIWDTGSGAPGTGTLLCSPIPIPTTLPAYIDVEFNTINGLAFTNGIVVAVSTTAPAYTAPGLGVATGTVTISYQ